MEKQKITGVRIDAMWEVSEEIPEGLVAWFNVLPQEVRKKIICGLVEMI